MHAINKKILMLALVLATMTAFFTYTYISGLRKPDEAVEYVNVIVAKKNIEKRATITAEDVKTLKVIKAYANHSAFSSTGEVVGKKAKEKIMEGEQVLKERIALEGQTILSYAIPEGKRAVAINVNEAAEVADFIRPGDFVDIIATFDKYEVEDSRTKTIYPRTTKTILQNILILGMGQVQDVPEKPRQELPKTVTLAVSPEEAERLVFGEETGVLRMALRRAGENNQVQTEGVLREDMVTERGKLVLPK